MDREIAQWGKHLLSKREDPSSGPGTSQRDVVAVHGCDRSAPAARRKVEGGQSPGSRPASLLCIQGTRDPVEGKNQDKVIL